MKPLNPTCFISYCHDDVDRDLVDYLVLLIKSTLKNKVHVYYDTELFPGRNFNKFMDKTLKVDVAIMLLTPKYKDKVDRREGGAYKEYQKIVSRYFSEIEKSSGEYEEYEDYIFSFELLPVVIGGSIQDSIPESIKDLKAMNLVGFFVTKDQNEEFILTEHIKRKFARELEIIAGQLVAIANLKSNAFKREREYLYKALFVETKTTSDLLQACPDFFQSVFVSTAAYSNVHGQKSYFLIGRKGSGKSTLATALTMIDPSRYNDCIALRADDVNLETAFGILRTNTQSDISNILSPLSFFNYTWQGFFVLCIIELLEKLSKEGKINEIQKSHMMPLQGFLLNFRQGHTKKNLKGAFFTYATARLQEYLDKCIQEARDINRSTFLADLDVSFNLDDFLSFAVGEDVVQSLKNIVDNCGKRVLVTLDDFDTIFDIFRRSSSPHQDYSARAAFETDWLRSLLLLVLNIKDKHYIQERFFKTLDFCITVPKDRYQQIERSERDGFRYAPRTSTIDWSGIELCDVLFYRLRKISGDSRSEHLKAHDRLEYMLKENYPGLPDNLEFQFNGKSVTIPLYCYVLRHTFWRPRDILMYYADILAAAHSVSKSGHVVTTPVLRRIISESTYQIIKTEFLDEYETTISNIRYVVNRFLEFPQVFGFDKLKSAIEDVPFLFNEQTSPSNDIIEKMEFLYDIGFLGVLIDDEIRSKLNINIGECFYFNEGTSPFRTAKKIDFRDVKFAIHPVFTENLQLQYKDNDLLLNLTWDYLYENHTIMNAVRS